MKTTEELLADLGLRQFVRTTILKIIKKNLGTEKDPQVVIDEINEKLIKDFKTIAEDESDKLFTQIKEKMG